MKSKVYVRMESLPSSIEVYLQEAGFSGTELIVLKKLLEEDALTLRELAAKTGKSTGVLDQAVKKLLRKKILSRENINDTPKYVLTSLNAVLHWMEDDMQLKQQAMARRHENFETFVRSLTVGKRRPDMEHFEGQEGLKKAYMLLLEKGNDFVHYGPTLYLEQEDPLRDFRVQYFRERRKRGIFSRIITHDSVLGRRFKTRDAFEYRKTILVDPYAYPFHFEKIIVGDTVACFQFEDEIACFIKYPQLAESERAFFERLWNKKIENQPMENSDKPLPDVITIKPVVSLKTRTLSHVREFFLSRRSIAAFAVCTLLSVAMTYGLYRHNIKVNLQRIQEKVLSIAATGALQFESSDIDKIHTINDINKPEYIKIIYQLNKIRIQNEGRHNTYLMRPTSEKNIYEFIADYDSLNPLRKMENDDWDGDGEITSNDHQILPGEKYDISSAPAMAEVIKTGKPTVDNAPTSDDWGVFISAYAPIKFPDGTVQGLFGVDIEAHAVNILAENTFTPIWSFIIFFLIFVMIRLAAFNRLTLVEISEIFKRNKFACITVGIGMFIFIGSAIAYNYLLNSYSQAIKDKAISIASTASLQFSHEDIGNLYSIDDISRPEYSRTINKLYEVYSQHKDIKHLYLIRPLVNYKSYNYIADVDAFNRDIIRESDINGNDLGDNSNKIGYPGLKFDISSNETLQNGRYFIPRVTNAPYKNRGELVFTGYSSILNESANTVALLAVDIKASKIYNFYLILILPIAIYLLGITAFYLKQKNSQPKKIKN